MNTKIENKPLMKSIISTIFLLIFSKTYAQTTKSSFTYDNAGNRILRSEIIIIGKIATLVSNNVANGQLEESIDGYHFTLYPNVVENNLNIKSEEKFLENEGNEIFVYDVNGKLLISKTMENTEEQIDFSNFHSGTFLVKIRNNNGFNSEWRIIKK